MFCPLCKAEFRDGFAECSDCHVPLVTTLREARSASALLWKGMFQTTLDRVLAVLDEQEIASCFKEIVNAKPSITIMGVPITPVRSTLEYEVWVFRTDLVRAKQAIESVRAKGNG